MKRISILSEKEQIDFLLMAKQAIENKEVRSLFHFCSLNGYDYYNVYARNRIYNVLHLTTENNGKFTTKQSRLTESDYEDILRMYNEGKTQREIGEFYGLSTASICHYFRKYNIKARDKETVGKITWSSLERRERQRLNGTRNYLKRRKFDTKPEKDFKTWCLKHNFRFVEQWRKVGNAHPYDFFLPDYNLLVEIDGHYWHTKPKQHEKDLKHVDDAIKRGYNIVRIDTEELKRADGDYMVWLKPYVLEKA